MRLVLSVLICLTLLSSCKESTDKDQTTYYLIRHAEKDRSDSTNKDPELTSRGLQRAEHWAGYFETIQLDHVYSTNYQRTMQTASPTAADKNVTIRSYDPRNLYDSIFRKETKNKKILVVGHSNTTPSFVNKIIGEEVYDDMDDSDNESLFIVNVSDNSVDHEIVKVPLPIEDEN